jgi:hypothetical protein
VALPFTLLKNTLRRPKKNYGKSNISPCKNILIFKKSSLKKKPKSFKILLLFCIPFGIEW